MRLGLINSAFAQAGRDTRFGLETTKKLGFDTVDIFTDPLDIDDDEREKRHFYAHLYIGLNHALEGQDKAAVEHLAKSTANRWGPRAGYGPHYMWHVGRLHYDLLIEKQKKTPEKPEAKQ